MADYLVPESGKSLKGRRNDEQSVCVLIKTEFVAVATDYDTRNLLSIVSRFDLFFSEIGRELGSGKSSAD